jgi:hypothetical protein
MKLPGLRFTVRRLMVVVAIVAIVFGVAELMKRRSMAFRLKAASHQRGLVIIGSHRYYSDASPAVAEYHMKLVEKYEHAARYPWLPVEADPPEPE